MKFLKDSKEMENGKLQPQVCNRRVDDRQFVRGELFREVFRDYQPEGRHDTEES